jgi:thiosulfate/3-mercaptopyruvate sulfurtransferase
LKKNLNSINHVHHLQDILLFFFSAHIPQARYFDQLEYTTPTKYIPRGIPEIKSFESYLSRLGVSNTDHIVLYDRSPMGLLASSRAWWLLKMFGMDSLSILDGGFYKWLKEIKDTESSNNTKTEETGKFTVRLNEQMIKNYEDMLRIVSTKNKSEQIVDARPPNIFNSSNAGHLPNSLNLPYTEVFDQTNQTLKSKDELKKLFNNAGVDLSKSAIYSCQTGTTASTLAFIAHILGQKSYSVYHGSFTEWQQRAPKELIISDKTNNPAA